MIKKIIYILCIVSLASCAETETENHFINGNEKTPVNIRISCQDGNVGTRAYDNTFEEADDIYVYLRHIIKNGENNFSPVNGTGTEPKLVTLKVISAGSSLSSNANNLSVVDPALGLYWDDFSAGGIGDNTHIRTENHALQSYYGYCFNGREKNNYLQESKKHNGEITWAVDHDQTSKFKTNDLLWSAEQTPVQYIHGANVSDSHGEIKIPFHHAMSMFTINVIVRNGFTNSSSIDCNALDDTTVEIQGVNTECTLTAYNATISSATNGTGEYAGKVKMFRADKSTTKVQEGTFSSRAYQAITVPQTVLTIGNTLFTITDVENNNYVVRVTNDMLTAWKSNDGLTNDNKTKSGYNYYLEVIIDKQSVSLEATLANWVEIKANGTGEIQFPDDVTGNDDLAISGDDGVAGSVTFTAEDKKKFNNTSNFDLYLVQHSEGKTDYSNSDFSNRKTISTYNSTKDKWENNPEIYWPDEKSKFYFRAIAIYTGETDDNKYKIETTNRSAPSLTTQHGTDIVWGTTAAHKGMNGSTLVHTYNEGESINPRTGEVPIAFRHIMSKITVSLETAQPETSGGETPANAVNLEGATISITNLSTSGTVLLYAGKIDNNNAIEGAITDFCSSNYTINEKTKLDNYTVIPQTITDNSMLIITLANNAGTYRIQLNKCMVKDTESNAVPTYITSWNPGRHYSYVIKLTKEDISFRALIKDWEETSVAGGDATLEW